MIGINNTDLGNPLSARERMNALQRSTNDSGERDKGLFAGDGGCLLLADLEKHTKFTLWH